MSRSRPRNWYEMSHDEQRAWQRETDDLDFRESQLCEQARAAEERADHEAVRRERATRELRRDFAERLDAWAAEVDQYSEFLKAKGLVEEFEAWKRERGHE